MQIFVFSIKLTLLIIMSYYKTVLQVQTEKGDLKIHKLYCLFLPKVIWYLFDRSPKTQIIFQQVHGKYKTTMCRDLLLPQSCPRGASCTFAHTSEEMERYRNQKKQMKSKPDGISGEAGM